MDDSNWLLFNTQWDAYQFKSLNHWTKFFILLHSKINFEYGQARVC